MSKSVTILDVSDKTKIKEILNKIQWTSDALNKYMDFIESKKSKELSEWNRFDEVRELINSLDFNANQLSDIIKGED